MQNFLGAACYSEVPQKQSKRVQNFWSGMSHFQVPEKTPEVTKMQRFSGATCYSQVLHLRMHQKQSDSLVYMAPVHI